jgi:chromosome partitioning protein
MATVGLPGDEFAERSRSIFERLRAEQEAQPVEVRDEASDSSPDADASADASAGATPTIRYGEPGEPEPVAGFEHIADEARADAGPVEEEQEQDQAPEPEPEPATVPSGEAQSTAAPFEPAASASVLTEPDPEAAPEPAAESDGVPLPADDAMPDPQRFVRPLPRVVALANQKGGVGKTTTTVNLGASLAVLGYRVLVIDLDPQGNATTGLGINSRNLESSIYDVILHDTPLDDCIEPTSLRNLFVAPATIDLAGAEIELVPAFSREQRLKRALQQVTEDYDFILIDCPPSLGLLTVNALSAASEVVVPIQCEYYALEGLGMLLRNINLVQSSLNPTLELSAIVLTMYDARTKLDEQVAAEVREHFGDKVCRIVVPRTVRLSEAPSFGQPIIVFDPSSRGALAYRELAREVSGGAPQRTG